VANLDPTPLRNMLLEPVEYQVEETAWGVWRRFMYPNQRLYAEFTTHAQVLGLPLLHYTRGICPETGRRRMAKGFIAVGRKACGVIAIGQAALGVIAIGQLALGMVLGLGQAATGLVSIGQAVLGVYFGLGQAATGYIAIAQFGYGHYVLAQFGAGDFVRDMRQAAPEAAEFFKGLLP
jgi:hypothetical protein